ncbi:MAG: hypothetical protein DRJ35_04125 [Thermoprotei archaeon]|nr:MAG: hypothetical protein DRJ35_04125 [Thermoprotei archaeon]
MSSKAWYALAIIFFLLFFVLGGWLWPILGILAIIFGYRQSKKEKEQYAYPPPQPAVYAQQPPPAVVPQNIYYPPPAPVQPAYQQVTARPVVKTPYPLVCPNCGQALSGYQPVCPRCGYRLNPIP